MTKVQRNILANYAAALWTAVMAIAFIPVYVRYLGIEAYGLIGIALVLQGCLALLDLGLAPALARNMAVPMPSAGEVKVAWNLLRSVELVVAGLALLIGVGLWLAATPLSVYWLTPKALSPDVVAHAFRMMGCLVALRLMENVYRSALVGRQRQVWLSALLALTATLRAVGTVLVLAWVEASVPAYFYWQVLVAASSVVLLGTATYASLPTADQMPRFSAQALRGIAAFASGSMLIAVLSLLLSNLDKLLLSRLLDLEQFGYYALAWALAQIPVGLVGPVAQAVYPRFSKLHGEGREQELSDTYHAAAQLITVLLGAASVTMAVFSLQVVTLWTGNPLLAQTSHVLVSVLVIGSMMNGLVTVPYFLQLAAGWTRLIIAVNVVALFLVVPLLWVAVERWGAVGAAGIWLALNLSYLLVIMPSMHARLLQGQLRSWYVHDVAVPIGVMVVLALCLQTMQPQSPRIWFLLLSLCVVTIGGALSAGRLRGPLVTLLRAR